MGMIGVELAARPPFLVVWVFWVETDVKKQAS